MVQKQEFSRFFTLVVLTFCFFTLYSQITCDNLKTIASRFSISAERQILPYVIGIFLTAWGYLFSVYMVIAHYEQERIKYVRT
jgi:predicted membrane protein